MFAIAGGPSFAGIPLTWSLLFARQPEPDLEFTEEELEQTTNVRSSPPVKSPKQSGGRPLLWVLLLVLIGGGVYAAMEPEMIMDLLGPILGESTAPQQQPAVAVKPAPPKPAPGTMPGQPKPLATTPVAPPVRTPQEPALTALPSPPPTTAASVPAPSVPTAPQTAAGGAPPIVAAPNPLFSEGQQVAILPDPAAPGEKVSLMQDAEGTKPGPAIPPGTILTILDGDLQGGGWVYSVRSGYGTKGWIAEKKLRPKS